MVTTPPRSCGLKSRAEHPRGVGSRQGRDLLGGTADGRREACRGAADECGLIALSPVRHRRQVRCVGLDQQAVDRDLPDQVVQLPAPEGDHAAPRDIVPQGEGGAEQRGAAAEGVQDGDGARVVPEDRGHVLVGLAGVDDRGPAPPPGHLHLGLERLALLLPGRVIVVVVESHLAGGHDDLVGQGRLAASAAVSGPQAVASCGCSPAVAETPV